MENILDHPRVKRVKDNYIKDPDKCPFCGSTNIVAHGAEANGTKAYSSVECNDCGNNWSDLYTLTGVAFTEEGYITIIEGRTGRNTLNI